MRLIAKQHFEPSLLEMTVASQCIRQSFAFHHDKRNAIRQRPFLVWTGRVKLNASGKQLVARWNDCYRWVVSQCSVKINERLPVRYSRQSVGQLGQNPFGRHELTIKSIVKSGRLAMGAVIGIEEGEEEECVGKKPVHFFGRPWR